MLDDAVVVHDFPQVLLVAGRLLVPDEFSSLRLIAEPLTPELLIPACQAGALVAEGEMRARIANEPFLLEPRDVRCRIDLLIDLLEYVIRTAAQRWLGHSDTIRRFHEMTHVICRRFYSGDVAPIQDELASDAMGLTTAYRRFDQETEKLFLGIQDGRYAGGRLGNYMDTPEALTEAVCAALERIRATIEMQAETEPSRLIPALMKQADIGETTTQTGR